MLVIPCAAPFAELTPMTEYDEYERLSMFFSNGGRAAGYISGGPETWTGVTWNSEGYVTAIAFEAVQGNINGTLVLRNFTALETLVINNASMIEINLSGCTALQTFNLSDNSYRQGTAVDFTGCSALVELYASDILDIDPTIFPNLEIFHYYDGTPQMFDFSAVPNLRELLLWGHPRGGRP